MHFFSKVFSADTSSSYSLNTACFNVNVEPLDKDNYRSTVDVAELGNLTIALVTNRSSIVARKGEQSSRPESKRYTLAYVVDGELVYSNAHGTSRLKPGQFTLFDNSLARTMFVYNSVTLLLVCASLATLQRHVPNPAAMFHQIHNEPLNDDGRPIFAPILCLWEHLKSGKLQDFATTIGEDFLEDLGKTFARQSSASLRSKHTQRLFNRIREHVEQNLHDPQLNAEGVAAAFGISTRYLRTLFQGGEKFSHYLQRRRIEKSAELLISPRHQGTSITDIAYACGFNSSTHFSRTFRAMFHESAREFRSRHQGMPSPPGA